MRKFLSLFIACLIIATIILMICINIYNSKLQSSHYLKELGLEEISSQKISQTIATKENIITQNDAMIVIQYNGFDIVAEKLPNDLYSFKYIEVYGEEHKFTWQNIGVQSTKEDVKTAYKRNKPIKDLPQNQLGYVVGDLWIVFQFVNDETVGKILLYYGP